MYIYGYLRAKNRMKAFVEEKGFRMASWYTETAVKGSTQLRLRNTLDIGDICNCTIHYRAVTEGRALPRKGVIIHAFSGVRAC